MYRSVCISYNGVTSQSLGCYSCKIENSNIEDVYVSGRDIKQDSSGRNWGNKSRNYFYKAQRNPQEFKVELFFKEFSDEKAREVSRLFFQDKYLPLIPSDTGRIYYCMPSGTPKISYSLGGGYVSMDMKTFNEYSYSDETILPFDLTGNTKSSITIQLDCDAPVYQTVKIRPLVSGSNIKIENKSVDNKYMEFSTDLNGNQLIANEIITVDCENEIIKTDQLSLYRYDNFSSSGDYLKLIPGTNTIEVSGSVILSFKYRKKYLF